MVPLKYAHEYGVKKIYNKINNKVLYPWKEKKQVFIFIFFILQIIWQWCKKLKIALFLFPFALRLFFLPYGEQFYILTRLNI